MNIIFFGLGSIGKRHAKLIQQNFDHEVFAFRGRKSNPNKMGIKELHDIKDIEKINPSAAFITNPTSKHIEYATICAEKGIDLFIEKPLSSSMKGLKEFEKIAKKNKIKVYVAYCMRFHPVINWLKNHLEDKKPVHISVYNSSYLPNWRPKISHLKNYSAHVKMGGGVILDLSHEIDYLYYLLGKPKRVFGKSGKASNVSFDAEDYADIILDYGFSCNLHLNFLSRILRREIVIDFKDHSVIADLIKNKIILMSEKGEQIREFEFQRDKLFISQLNYFFGKGKMNNLREAIEVFDIIMQIKEAVK